MRKVAVIGDGKLISSLTNGEGVLVVKGGAKQKRIPKNAGYVEYVEGENPLPIALGLLGDANGKTVVIDTKSEADNLSFARYAADYIVKSKAELKVYAFTSSNGDEYDQIEQSTLGKVRYVNAHKRQAIDFIKKHCVADFIKNKINYATATCSGKVGVAYVGFGGANRQMLLASVMNDRLITSGVNWAEPLVIDYYVYTDGCASREGIEGLSNYLRERDGLKNRLPLPAGPASLRFCDYKVGGEAFYDSLIENCAKNEVAYVAVNFGGDGKNVRVALEIDKRLKSAKLKTKVFVRVSGKKSVKELDRSGVTAYGFDYNVYSLSALDDERLELAAGARHKSYAAQSQESVARLFSSERVTRESNYYAWLGVNLKLKLLGYELAELSDKRVSCEDEFYKSYIEGSDIKYTQAENGVRRVDYGDCNFKRDNVRYNLALQEHDRWNAYMICNGFMPAEIEQIGVLSKSKLSSLRLSANITTFEGLLKYRKMVAKRFGLTESEADVIKYDFQFMDELTEVLPTLSLKIVRA